MRETSAGQGEPEAVGGRAWARPGSSLWSHSGSRATQACSVSHGSSPRPAPAPLPAGRAKWGTLAALTGPGPCPRRRASLAPPPAAGRAPRPAGLGPPPRAAASPPAAAGAAAPRPATNGTVSSAPARPGRPHETRTRTETGDTHTERGDGRHTPTASRCQEEAPTLCPQLQIDASPEPSPRTPGRGPRPRTPRLSGATGHPRPPLPLVSAAAGEKSLRETVASGRAHAARDAGVTRDAERWPTGATFPGDRTPSTLPPRPFAASSLRIPSWTPAQLGTLPNSESRDRNRKFGRTLS